MSDTGSKARKVRVRVGTGASLTGWRRAILYVHRWLGIFGGLLFLLWFVSGIVMMYARMPSFSPEERLARQRPLDLGKALVPPAEAARRARAATDRLRIGMLGDRPVYRFYGGPGWTTVFAEDARALEGLSADEALRLVRGQFPESALTLRYDGYLTKPDQWTLQSGAFFPLHRVAAGDRADTRLYVSDRTGEVVMKTDARGRRLAYVGAVVHWLYFTPLRSHPGVWLRSVLWISIAGCVLTLSGLLWGILRFSPAAVFRHQGSASRSPYAGLLRWHHYAGLLFGLFTFTWILSGALSLDPWGWSPPTSPTAAQREAVAGGRLRIDTLTLPGLRAGLAALSASFPVKELELVRFRGETFLLAERPPDEGIPRPAGGRVATYPSGTPVGEHLLVAARAPERGTFQRFGDDAVLAAARDAMPGVDIENETWLNAYDGYYYDRDGGRPLPVLRVRFGDARRTWLYLDPGRGAIVRREERRSRLNRWLYHGLHSLDFPFLYSRRPLWDIVVIVLALGGILVSGSTLLPAWRRLARHSGRLWRR